MHQSQLMPGLNKFHKGAPDGKHYWITPPDLYKKLDEEFHFDFDPCPYPLPEGFDGLTCEWGQRNYVNPPFGSIIHKGPNDKKPKKKGCTAWIRKAIEEQKKGKLVVFVYPLDKWIFLALEACGLSEIRNLGDIRWHSIEDNTPGNGTGRHIAMFVFRPVKDTPQQTLSEATTSEKPDPSGDITGGYQASIDAQTPDGASDNRTDVSRNNSHFFEL